jgi:hypothetical protein
MTLVKRLVSSTEPNRSAAILLNKLGQFRFRQSRKAGVFFISCFHRITLSTPLSLLVVTPRPPPRTAKYTVAAMLVSIDTASSNFAFHSWMYGGKLVIVPLLLSKVATNVIASRRRA